MQTWCISRRRRVSALLSAVLSVSLGASAEAAEKPVDAGQAPYALPPVTVAAEKQEQNLQDVPVSVTAFTAEALRHAGIQDLRDTGNGRVPNLIYSQFAPPAETFPFVRGIGSGRNAPAVTTYYDGVPQLSFATSNIQFLNVDRVEFLRGPQTTLYGRNTLGGVINVYSQKPTNHFTADGQAMFGTYNLQDYRATVSGPIVKDNLYFSFSGGYLSRDGFSKNTVNGHDLDYRNDLFGRMELLWAPSKQFELRLMINGERDRDGDFPLADLGTLGHTPRRVAHDFEGGADRTVTQYALSAAYHGEAVEITSISAYQEWHTHERTDLDETPLDLLRRSNNQSEHNLVEELRFASPKDKPITFCKEAKLNWLAGVFAFRQQQEGMIGNVERNPAALGLPVPFPFTSYADSSILNYGVGAFGQATLTLWDKLDITGGVRYDYEHAHGHVTNSTSPALSAASGFDQSKSFDRFSPRVEVGYHWTKDIYTYGSAAEGYKSGGFNSTAPPANDSFGAEKSWDYEVGVKTSWLKDRLTVNADLFYIDWRNMQLDVPIPGQPSQFYIDNVGKSASKGAEIEAVARPIEGLDVFGGVGYTNAYFRSYTLTSGASAHGNRLPFAPEVTWNAGTQYSFKVCSKARAYARAEVLGVGHYFYDATNAARQSSYIITNFRVGVAGEHWRLEAFIDNAFDTHYTPIAFPFPGLAPSGYVGESGAPQQVGLSLGVMF